MKRFMLFSFLAVVIGACQNEPYILSPLRVTNLRNTVTSVTNTYQYRQQQLYLFTSVNGNTALATHKFLYADNRLQQIISDSTSASYTLTQLHYKGDVPERDSVFTVAADLKSLLRVRVYQFNGANELTGMVQHAWNGSVVATEEYAFENQNGNVVRLSKYQVTNEGKDTLLDMDITFNDRNNIYPKQWAFHYTLPPEQWFWLSTNGPIKLKEEGKKEVINNFLFNPLGYPFAFDEGLKERYIASYTEIL